jgi:hypothetical protein
MMFLQLLQMDGIEVTINFEHVLAFQRVDAQDPASPTKLIFALQNIQPLMIKQKPSEIRAMLARSQFTTVPT